MLRPFAMIALLWGASAAILFQLSVPTMVTALILVIVFFTVASRCLRYGTQGARLAKSCTGFTVLDLKGKPIRNTNTYTDYFRAFATWEECDLRPAAVQHLSKKILERLHRTRRLLVKLGKEVRFPQPKTELDRQVLRMHLALTTDEQKLNPLLEREEILVTEINNLSLKISGDRGIRRARLLRKLNQLEEVEVALGEGLTRRGDAYDYWLSLLGAKGLTLRFSLKGAVLSATMAAALAALTRNPMPLSRLSVPFLKYVIDATAGVRALRRKSGVRREQAKRIRTYIERISPNLDSSLIRLPRSS